MFRMLATSSHPHILRLVPSPRSLVCTRSISYRQKLYGNEEGHDKKNEVRKEKWIRKKTMRQSLGGDYREFIAKKSRNPHSGGNPLVDLPDWSYADQTPGTLSDGQIRRIAEHKELCSDILESLIIVNKASKMNTP